MKGRTKSKSVRTILSPTSKDRRRWRRRYEAMPHRATIKLNGEPVRGINGSFIPILCPDMTPIIDPCPRWLTDFIDEVEIPAVLSDESQARPPAILRALVRAGKRCN